MTDKVVVLVTAGKLGEARKIARQLVESRLAACVNITTGIQSVYRWQGKLVNDKEYLIVIKSSRELFPELQAEILRLHSYTTPEVICLPIIDGSADYLSWLQGALKSRGEETGATGET